MAIETEKNAASGGTAIDENRGQDDVRQKPKKSGTSTDVVASLDQRVASVETSMAELKNQVEGLEGLDSDFTSMRENFRVALNTLSGDLKHAIHDLRNSFMGEITKIRKKFGEEIFTLHQVIEDLQADMALCKRCLASGGDNTNHDQEDDPVLEGYRDVMVETSKYGDIERGTTTIDTWAEFMADFKKQFYPENAKNEAKSRLRKLKQSGTIREYVKEFTTLVLEIPELSDQDSLFYFLDGLQGWAKTELERRGVQDLSTIIAHVEALIDFSTRRNRLSQKIESARDFLKKVSLNRLSAHGNEGASGGRSMGSIRILNAIKAKTMVSQVIGKGLQYVEATINGVKVRAFVDSGATHNFMADDEAKRLGINAMKGSGTLKAVNSLAKAIYRVAKDVPTKIRELEGMTDLLVVPMDDFKVVLGLEFPDKGSSKVEVPKAIERVLEKFKDVMPKEFPKKLPPRKEVDHTIELETGSEPLAKAPYRMPLPELEELHYRELNKVTIKNKYPIPLIADLFDQLGKARYFTKLDLRSGYYQVRIAKGDEAKMTCGSYVFLVMPFGLTNALVTFCTLMIKLFHPFLDKFVMVYLDDIVVYSYTLEDHVLHLKQIKDGGLMMDGAKIKAIQDWESPTKVTEPIEEEQSLDMRRRVPSGVREFEKSGYGRAGVETIGCDHAFRVTHRCIELCYWRSSNARWTPDCIREPEVKRDGKEVHGARERDDGGCPLLEDLEALFQDFLAEFDYQLEYKPGKANVVADALSHKVEFVAITQAQFFLQDRIKEGLEHDPLAKKIIALAKDERTRRFCLKEDMLFTKEDRL
nr:hypothetical protein [Tanacetum cinerariifolium]